MNRLYRLALVLLALAGILGLALTEPVGAVGATLDEFPPPLPLDVDDDTSTDWLSWAIPIGGFAIVGLGLLAITFDLGLIQERRRSRKPTHPRPRRRV